MNFMDASTTAKGVINGWNWSFPNPAGTSMLLQWEGIADLEVMIFDLAGNVV